MVKLYGMPGACSLGPHILLEEAKIPFEYRLVRKNEASFDEVRQRNLMGQVPVLEFEDGTLLTQNAAILYWIASQAPEARLLPPEGSLERARVDEWIAFIGTTLHPAYVPLFNPSRVVATPEHHEDAKAVAKETVAKLLGIAEARLGEGPWILGETYSAADPYLYPFFSWAGPVAKLDLSPYPKLLRHAEALRARPAAQRAFETEGIKKG